MDTNVCQQSSAVCSYSAAEQKEIMFDGYAKDLSLAQWASVIPTVDNLDMQ